MRPIRQPQLQLGAIVIPSGRASAAIPLNPPIP